MFSQMHFFDAISFPACVPCIWGVVDPINQAWSNAWRGCRRFFPRVQRQPTNATFVDATIIYNNTTTFAQSELSPPVACLDFGLL
jgi:hypothetical protein